MLQLDKLVILFITFMFFIPLFVVPALEKCPQKSGICTKVVLRPPRKSNSTKRWLVKVRLSNRKHIYARRTVNWKVDNFKKRHSEEIPWTAISVVFFVLAAVLCVIVYIYILQCLQWEDILASFNTKNK